MLIQTLDLITIGTILGLTAIGLVPEKPRRFFWGGFLLVLGLLPVLYVQGVIAFDIYSYPLTSFVAVYSVMLVGGVLFVEGIKEQNIALKILSIFIGFVIIILTCVPWAAEYGATSIQLPEYAPIINFAIYIAAGIITIIGAFKIEGMG